MYGELQRTGNLPGMTGKTPNMISEDSLWSGWDSKWTPPECESGVLTATCLVLHTQAPKGIHTIHN